MNDVGKMNLLLPLPYQARLPFMATLVHHASFTLVIEIIIYAAWYN
jgi:hypothetical protein